MQYLYVAVGGGVGAVARFFCQSLALTWWPNFPFGTVLVNIVGSFLAGFILPFLPMLPEPAKPFVFAGLLGGFTTFSAFSLETTLMLTEKRVLAALVNWGIGAFLCVAVCYLGFSLGNVFAKNA